MVGGYTKRQSISELLTVREGDIRTTKNLGL